jgi:hypothetical protein
MRRAGAFVHSLALVLPLVGIAALPASSALAMSAKPHDPVSVGTCPDALNTGAVGAVVVVSKELAESLPGLTDPAFEPPAKGEFVLYADVPEPNRLVPPRTIVTRDFRPNRLNLETDPAGVIRRLTCG